LSQERKGKTFFIPKKEGGEREDLRKKKGKNRPRGGNVLFTCARRKKRRGKELLLNPKKRGKEVLEERNPFPYLKVEGRKRGKESFPILGERKRSAGVALLSNWGGRFPSLGSEITRKEKILSFRKEKGEKNPTRGPGRGKGRYKGGEKRSRGGRLRGKKVQLTHRKKSTSLGGKVGNEGEEGTRPKRKRRGGVKIP